MLQRLMDGLEFGFFITFWFQTRINLREWWPSVFSSPLNSDYLIPFVYLTDILLISLLLVWIADKVMQRGIWRVRVFLAKFQFNPMAWIKTPLFWWGSFWLTATISVWINGGEWWNWYGWLRLSEGLLFSWYIFDRWQLVNLLRRAIGWLIFGLCVESVLIIGEWIMQRSLGLQWIGEWSFNVHTPGIAKVIINGQEFLRGYGTFAHPNIAASGLLLGLVVLSWWLLRSIQKSKPYLAWPQVKSNHVDIFLVKRVQPWLEAHDRAILWGLGFLLSVGMFLTFSRSAWLVGGACLTLLLVWSGRYLVKRLTKRRLVGGMIAIVVLTVTLGPVVLGRFNSLDNTDRLSVERRVHLNDVAVTLIQQQPALGVGLNNFIPHLANFGPLYGVGIWREPAHNLYLLIAAEVGLIGLGLWLVAQSFIWVQIGLKLWQGNADSRLPLLLTLWVAVILLGLVDHYWWTSQQGRLVWWMLVGGSLAGLQLMQKPALQPGKSKI